MTAATTTATRPKLLAFTALRCWWVDEDLAWCSAEPSASKAFATLSNPMVAVMSGVTSSGRRRSSATQC